MVLLLPSGSFVVVLVILAASTILSSPTCSCFDLKQTTHFVALSPFLPRTKTSRLLAAARKKNRKRWVPSTAAINDGAGSTDVENEVTGKSFDISDDHNQSRDEVEDTIRVRIWRTLASGNEFSLKQLGAVVGQRKDLKSHLAHVEKQSRTLKNKKIEWFRRRGLLSSDLDNNDVVVSSSELRKIKKLRLIQRRGSKGEVYVRLG